MDDDDGLRALLRTTFEAVDVEVDEASNATTARERIEVARPDAIVLDVSMPGLDGAAFCAQLKASRATRDIPVVLLTGSDMADEATAAEVGAEAFMLKPFSPLELLAIVERVAAGLHATPFRASGKRQTDEQLLLYARDLRHLLEVERGQRRLLQDAYHATVTALASALESKDTGTGEHSQRVHRYAVVLAQEMAPELVEDESVEYGFMLHDFGKIGIPDYILQKPGPLTSTERRPRSRERNASTTSGSNCAPDSASISRVAAAHVSAGRYGRSLVIASSASATANIRAATGISSPARRSG